MSASLLLSAVLCSLALPAAFSLGDEPPYMDTLRQVVWETNQYLTEKHLDFVDIPAGIHGNFFSSFKIVGGKVGNFASAEIVGESYLNETDLADKTAYYFSIGIGLKEMKIALQYNAKFLGIFSSSGTINVVNTGNAAVAVGVVSSSGTGTSHKCEVELDSVDVQKVGQISLSFAPSTISHWIMEKFSSVLLRVVAPFASSVINKTVHQISQKDQVKEILKTVMCRYF